MLAGALATLITLVMAWPAVRHPSRLVYGTQIVGRHPDLHIAIAQMAHAGPGNPVAGPLTDAGGRLIARMLNPVAALNLIVLVTFPLTAMATYAFARYLHGSHGAALIACLIFAFAPARLAQAAYHPYVVQTQWLPLFFLALAALVERVTPLRVAGAAIASLLLAFSNYDAALLGIVLAPVALLMFWVIRRDADRNLWPLVWATLIMLGITGATIGGLLLAKPSFLQSFAGFAYPVEDIGLFRAHWWSYFVPSVDHPLLGRVAAGIFGRRGIRFELLEQQLFLGYAFTALAMMAVVVAAMSWRNHAAPERRRILALTVIALAAALISLGPSSGACDGRSAAVACFLYRVAPMFHAYARFGLLVILVVAVAAGVGAMWLAARSRAGSIAAAVLLAIGTFEFWPLPARAHDILPTTAHRALMSLPPGNRILDCYPQNQADALVPWLMKQEMSFLTPSLSTCGDPQLGLKLAAQGYTHIIVRGGDASSKLLSPLPPAITRAHTFADSAVYTVSKVLPPVVTLSSSGFFDYEHDGDDWWRWLSPVGTWTVRNTTAAPQRVRLTLELVAIGMPRSLTVTLDGAPAGTTMAAIARGAHVLGPWTLTPGDHVLSFAADGEPMRPADVADNSRDRRLLTVAFRNEEWVLEPQ
jgi:hypothetical protein